MVMAPPQRYTYDRDQLERYYERIAFPKTRRLYTISNLSDNDRLAYLRLLQKHELVKVPWENTVQHYSWHRVVNVKALHLFRKIVGHAGRGGYCMEANMFFHTVLLSLGFDCYIAGSRVYNPDAEAYGGWTHCVNLVTVGGVKYLLDGGFGASGPSRPVPLDPGRVTAHIEPAQCRVTYESLPQYLSRDSKVWIYQHRTDPGRDWATMYCFTDLEFLPADVEAMNFAPWLSPQTVFTHKIMCVRFTTDKEGEDPGSPSEEALRDSEIDGTLTIDNDVLKWRRHGKKVLEIRFKSDAERVETLRKYFGIILDQEEIEAIAGSAAEVPSKPFETR